MILQHKYIIRLLPLRFFIHWNDVYLVALGLRHLLTRERYGSSRWVLIIWLI